VARFAALDVTANMQPLWASHERQMDELTIPFLGEERTTWQYPFAGLVAAGARLGAGSDWPVSSPNPLWGIHVAVNRAVPVDAGPVERAFLPEQSLDLSTALTAYTAGSSLPQPPSTTAVASRSAARPISSFSTATSSPGPTARSARPSLDATYVDGRVVYER